MLRLCRHLRGTYVADEVIDGLLFFSGEIGTILIFGHFLPVDEKPEGVAGFVVETCAVFVANQIGRELLGGVKQYAKRGVGTALPLPNERKFLFAWGGAVVFVVQFSHQLAKLVGFVVERKPLFVFEHDTESGFQSHLSQKTDFVVR